MHSASTTVVLSTLARSPGARQRFRSGMTHTERGRCERGTKQHPRSVVTPRNMYVDMASMRSSSATAAFINYQTRLLRRRASLKSPLARLRAGGVAKSDSTSTKIPPLQMQQSASHEALSFLRLRPRLTMGDALRARRCCSDDERL